MRSRFGIDISAHRSRKVRDVSVEDFDYIIAMHDDVKDDLRKNYPTINARLISWNIKDPIPVGDEVYERSAREIQKCVEQLPAYLKKTI